MSKRITSSASSDGIGECPTSRYLLSPSVLLEPASRHHRGPFPAGRAATAYTSPALDSSLDSRMRNGICASEYSPPTLPSTVRTFSFYKAMQHAKAVLP